MGLNARLTLRLSFMTACLLALSACVTGPRFANLDAVIVPTEPLDLPSNAELTVRLEDVSRGSDVIAVSTYTRLGRGPIPVMLRYDAKAIDEDRPYVLRADIRSNKTLTHRNVEEVPVLTGEAPRNDVRVPIESIDR
ncbi:YbaY family lipoprotein [Halomonas sp. GXIMD04776]|uniref:YbaY family lipoprotein n=1 Tax=Halomonas sp. GXIMD04776 TaxID=3415605 RepID=UPI003C8F6D51